MSFITNNIEWAASSVCDLYKNRWGIETFFGSMDFLGGISFRLFFKLTEQNM